MFQLNGTRILIAGGSSGIGLSTAKLLVSCGATVVISARDQLKLEAAQKQLGDRVSVVPFDATEPNERAQALLRIGPFDHIVIALSGGKGAGPFAQVTTADLRSGFEAKFWAHFSLAQESLPYLSQSGRSPSFPPVLHEQPFRVQRAYRRLIRPLKDWSDPLLSN
jgi:NAD(P)-dependent dehydrogenase (short-subunit alcohol dehydrogenase family)